MYALSVSLLWNLQSFKVGFPTGKNYFIGTFISFNCLKWFTLFEDWRKWSWWERDQSRRCKMLAVTHLLTGKQLTGRFWHDYSGVGVRGRGWVLHSFFVGNCWILDDKPLRNFKTFVFWVRYVNFYRRDRNRRLTRDYIRVHTTKCSNIQVIYEYIGYTGMRRSNKLEMYIPFSP